MARIPTVKIRDGDGYRIINESDFSAEEHQLYAEDGVYDDDEKEGLAPVEIPEGWRALHWQAIVALAKKVTGDETIMTKDAAFAAIEVEEARRAQEAEAAQ